jgi:hypothetical protein
LAGKRLTRCTLTKPIVSGTASRPPGVRRVGQEWRRTDVNHVACADRLPVDNPLVLSTPSQKRRHDSRMFPDAAGLQPTTARACNHFASLGSNAELAGDRSPEMAKNGGLLAGIVLAYYGRVGRRPASSGGY